MKVLRWIPILGLIVVLGHVAATGYAANTPTPQVSVAQDTCTSDPSASQVRYHFDATLNWAAKVVEVEQTVLYRHDGDEPLNEIVFHSEPYRLSRVNTMTFNNAQDADGDFLNNVTIDAMRITVGLDAAVPTGCDVVVILRYAINLQPLSDTNPLGWLAYTDHQVNLGHWFPTVGVYGFETPNEWYTPQRYYIGEQAITPVADYVLDFEVTGAPAGLTIAAPGAIESLGAASWRIEHNNSRELALSLSTQFVVQTEVVDDVSVEWYTFTNPSADAMDRAMTDAVQALQLFSELYGPYPHERLVIVEGDFDDGYEFSGLVFVSTYWFEIWNGRADHWLSVITIHEIAHQWWYSMVGSNQAETPYLDEALATISELFYYERYAPDLVDSWWSFRVNRYDILGDVDSVVYDYTQWRPYINTVYLNGVKMFDAIRQDIGDAAFFVWLSNYWQANVNQIATPTDLWSTLPADLYAQTSTIRQTYLADDDPLS